MRSPVLLWSLLQFKKVLERNLELKTSLEHLSLENVMHVPWTSGRETQMHLSNFRPFCLRCNTACKLRKELKRGFFVFHRWNICSKWIPRCPLPICVWPASLASESFLNIQRHHLLFLLFSKKTKPSYLQHQRVSFGLICTMLKTVSARQNVIITKKTQSKYSELRVEI